MYSARISACLFSNTDCMLESMSPPLVHVNLLMLHMSCATLHAHRLHSVFGLKCEPRSMVGVSEEEAANVSSLFENF